MLQVTAAKITLPATAFATTTFRTNSKLLQRVGSSFQGPLNLRKPPMAFPFHTKPWPSASGWTCKMVSWSFPLRPIYRHYGVEGLSARVPLETRVSKRNAGCRARARAHDAMREQKARTPWNHRSHHLHRHHHIITIISSSPQLPTLSSLEKQRRHHHSITDCNNNRKHGYRL